MNDTINMNKMLELLSSNLSDEDICFASIASDISLEIIKQRTRMKYTQAEFAKYLNVTQAMVSKWENGDYNFTIRSLASLSQKLHLDLKISLQDPNTPFSVGINSNDFPTYDPNPKVINFPNCSFHGFSSSDPNWSTKSDELKEL